MFEKTLDAISLFLVIWKLNIGHSTSRNDIGVVMAVLEATAIGMQLIDIVLTILPMIQVCSVKSFLLYITGVFCRK